MKKNIDDLAFKTATRSDLSELVDAVEKWVNKKFQYKGEPKWCTEAKNWVFPSSYSDGRWQIAEKNLVRAYLGTPRVPVES